MGRKRTWEGEGEKNWVETGRGKEKARRIGTRRELGRKKRGELGRDGKWERKGEENWDETGSEKEKARRIGTRQEMGRRR